MNDPHPSEVVADQAVAAVLGPRRDDYGPPGVNHERTARLWSAYLEIPVTAEQVCWLNVLQKIAREQNAGTEDGLVDSVGYVLNVAELRADTA